MSSFFNAIKRRQFHRLLVGSMALAGLETTFGRSSFAESASSESSPPSALSGTFKAASNQFAIQFLKSVIASQPSKNQFLS
ncbi:MAG: hypothetical protein U0930_24785, partial [Pirellulales bacterium]